MAAEIEKYHLSIPESPPQQHVFLLRCIEIRSQMPPQQEAQTEWRFNVVNPKDNAVHNFGDFQSLMTFLKTILNDQS